MACILLNICHPPLSVSSRLYWTYVAYNSTLDMNVGVELHYMDPWDFTMTEYTVPLDGYPIRNVTIETETGCLYWVSIVNAHSVTITKRCPGNESNIVVHTTSASLTGLAVTMVSGHSLVFWYDVEEKAVFLLNGTQVIRYREWSSDGVRVVGLLAHTKGPGEHREPVHAALCNNTACATALCSSTLQQ